MAISLCIAVVDRCGQLPYLHACITSNFCLAGSSWSSMSTTEQRSSCLQPKVEMATNAPTAPPLKSWPTTPQWLHCAHVLWLWSYHLSCSTYATSEDDLSPCAQKRCTKSNDEIVSLKSALTNTPVTVVWCWGNGNSTKILLCTSLVGRNLHKGNCKSLDIIRKTSFKYHIYSCLKTICSTLYQYTALWISRARFSS